MTGDREVDSQYLGVAFSADNFKELFPEHSDLNYEELLQQQESVYQSLQESGRKRGRTSDEGQSHDGNQLSGQEGGSSQRGSGGGVESQLALDEALARLLQELGDDFDGLFISDGASGNRGENSGGTPVSSRGITSASPDVQQDDIDPDQMTYEQMLSLGDSVGAESKGLSQELISRLTSFKYKTRLFSKKKMNEECVICCKNFERGKLLISLPCAHKYHSKCITPWLKIRKTCPICNKEVRDY
ncbi:E3 ubiquitin-protein ligase BIG BROTHER-like isoform X2 [Cornus florida]|uniref:E3 ubiquitin-protein ligase BIG BROTHER-like isoform X2 n=1 Tax=Cornus florida TaxID=4283 RepID=UPI00289E6DCF|nr:E3 ubiquitin-protein ligase BIG BROTHER-like isoform X2 [Cornus florida]